MTQSRGVADALVDAAATAVQQWTYERGPEPTTVQVSFRFYPDREVAEDFLPPPPPPPPRLPTSATPGLVPGGVVGGVPGGVVGGVVGGVGGGIEQSQAGPPYRIGGSMKPPLKLVHVAPVYPPDARAARVQGVVIIETVIDEAGNVSDARILRSIPLLDQAALDAVRQWKFVPTLLNGAAVPVIMTVTVNFTLDGAVARAVGAQGRWSGHLISSSGCSARASFSVASAIRGPGTTNSCPTNKSVRSERTAGTAGSRFQTSRSSAR